MSAKRWSEADPTGPPRGPGREGLRFASFQCHQIGQHVVHVLVRIHVQELVVHREGVIADHLELRGPREGVYFAFLVADRDVEIVEDHRDAGYRRAIRRSNREGQLLAATASATAAPAASAAAREEEAALKRGRVVAAAEALQVARYRVAGAALARTVEPGFSRLRVTRDDLLRLKDRRAAERVVNPLVDEVGEVGYLGLRKRCRFAAALHGVSLGEEGDERAAVAVVQDHIGLDE